MKIYLDIDDVIADWVPTFCKRYNNPIPTTWVNPYVTIERLTELKKIKQYWIDIPIRHRPDFQPTGYLSARSIPKKWTYEFMKLNKIPGRSNINQVAWNVSKIEKLKEFGCTIFIDDKVETFEDCHKHGIFCLLMDTPWNQEVNTEYRVFDLKFDTIMRKFEEWQKLQ